jgi:hypothetical protein
MPLEVGSEREQEILVERSTRSLQGTARVSDAEVLIADRLVGLSLSHLVVPFWDHARCRRARFSVGVSSKIARKRGRARLRGGRTS